MCPRDFVSDGNDLHTSAVRFLGVLCLTLAIWGASPGWSANFDPKFYEESRNTAEGYLSAGQLQGQVGEELVVTSKLPADVSEADFTLEASILSPEGNNDLQVVVEGSKIRIKAANPGEFVLAVSGIRPSLHSM